MSNKLMVFELIDRLNILLSTSPRVPLSGRIVVDKQQVSALLQQIEDSISPDVKNAQKLLEMEKQIIQESQKQAQDTVAEANNTAHAATEDATRRAQATLADAQARAAEVSRNASDKANAMVADAQARAGAMIADAQARAQQLVSESEIVARAQSEAQDMIESARQECEGYRQRVSGDVNALLEHADVSMTQQLDALRQLRQDIGARQS